MTSDGLTRRGFVEWLIGAGTGLVGVFYLGTAAAMLKPPAPKAATWQDMGVLSKYPLETPTLTTYTGEGVEDGIFVVRHARGTPTVFDFHCPHLECAVRWVGAANEFACPCHGSTYNIRGQHTGGPAPHGLWYHAAQMRGSDLWVGGETGANAGNARA